MRGVWGVLVQAYRDAGLMPADVSADHVARTFIAIAQGFIAQQALFGDVRVEQVQDGLRALMSMGAERKSAQEGVPEADSGASGPSEEN